MDSTEAAVIHLARSVQWPLLSFAPDLWTGYRHMLDRLCNTRVSIPADGNTVCGCFRNYSTLPRVSCISDPNG
jgi:hypothetical protein